MNNVAILHSKTALNTPSTVMNNISLNDCTVQGNIIGIFFNPSGTITVARCTFLNNQYGLYLNQGVNGIGSAILLDSVFIGNQIGLYAYCNSYYYYNFTLVITNTLFFNHEYQGIQLQLYNYYGYGSPQIHVYIQKCIFNSSQIYWYTLENSIITVQDSIFANYTGSAIYASGKAALISVTNTTIMEINGFGVEIALDALLTQLLIDDNNFKLINQQACISVAIQPQSLSDSNISISGNTFVNNTVQNVIALYDQSNGHSKIVENIFENPESTYDLLISSPWKSGYVIEASRNWWGSTDQSYVLSRISDFYLNYKTAEVNLSVIYSNVDLSLEMSTSKWRSWSSVNQTLGGRLDQNVTLNDTESTTYNISTSIYVPKDIQLVVTGQMILQFLQSRGIVVEGRTIIVIHYCKFEIACL